MQDLDPSALLDGKNEASSIRIARRTGAQLSSEDVSDADRKAAELVARVLVEHTIERVRSELSKAIRHARHLPRDLALKLAHDVDSVACPFLEVTEVFSESDWQQLVLTISRSAQIAVARRASLSEGIAKSLVEVGDHVVAETLVENPAAPMTKPVCRVLMERFGAEIWILEKLAAREDLMVEIAVDLASRVSECARRKLISRYNLPDFTEPLATEAENAVLLKTVKETSAEALLDVVDSLQAAGKLTPLLVLAGLRERQLGFVEAAFSVAAARSLEHVRSVIQRANSEAIVELLKRARVPGVMHEEFRLAIQAVRTKSRSASPV